MSDIEMDDGWIIEHTPFKFPKNMKEALQKVFEGSYNLEARKWKPDLPHRPRILDLGANCGAFSVFATKRWPGCIVEAFEPSPDMFPILKKNTKHLAEVHIHNVAIAAEAGRRNFYAGPWNYGEGSLIADINLREGATPQCEVTCVAAASLPQADIIKCDIEGAEWEFVDNYPFLGDAALIMIEYHRNGDKEKLEEKLKPLGFVVVTARVSQNDPGELIFARQKDVVFRK